MRKHRLEISQVCANRVLREVSVISEVIAISVLQLTVQRHVQKITHLSSERVMDTALLISNTRAKLISEAVDSRSSLSEVDAEILDRERSWLENRIGCK